jgi:hypothetical protein
VFFRVVELGGNLEFTFQRLDTEFLEEEASRIIVWSPKDQSF